MLPFTESSNAALTAVDLYIVLLSDLQLWLNMVPNAQALTYTVSTPSLTQA